MKITIEVDQTGWSFWPMDDIVSPSIHGINGINKRQAAIMACALRVTADELERSANDGQG